MKQIREYLYTLDLLVMVNHRLFFKHEINTSVSHMWIVHGGTYLAVKWSHIKFVVSDSKFLMMQIFARFV